MTGKRKETPLMFTHRYPEMVHEYHVQNVRRILEARRERVQALKTKADADAYVRRVRRSVRQSFAPYFPHEKCDLNARVTGRRVFETFTLETVVYQSRPDFFVTGNLYLPRRLDPPVPGVLGLCGHALEGKAAEAYRAFAQSLAMKGFACFVIDPISQGERWQHDKPRGAPMPGLCHAHNLMGNAMVLTDDYFGSWRAWDGIRGLDYLLTRPEVDPARVGVTGNSGGGTMTTFLTALDARFTMAAPSCYVCSMQVSLENETPADAEQNPPGLLAAGLDQVDLLLAYAPRPTLILAQAFDFFDARFAKQAYLDLRRVHTLLGSPRSAGYFCGPTSHGFSVHNRERMYAFFMKQAGLKGSAKEGHLIELSPEQLRAAPGGSVGRLGSRRVFDRIGEAARDLAATRPRLDRTGLERAARRVLGVRVERRPPHYRVTARYIAVHPRLRMSGQFLAETEPGILTVLTSCGGPGHHKQCLPKGRVIAYIGHTSGEEDLLDNREARALLRDTRTVVAIDPRGIGQSESHTCGTAGFFNPYGADYLYASTGEMLGTPYAGRRVYDTLRALDLLYAHGAEEIELVGRGLGAVTAAFAGLLHPKRPRVRLIHYLPSYELITKSPYHVWPLSCMPRAILRSFDLPDLYRALGSTLTLTQPWDEQMKSSGKPGRGPPARRGN